MAPLYNNLIEMLETRASTTPDKLVMSFINIQGKFDAQYSFSLLSKRARAIAHFLKQKSKPAPMAGQANSVDQAYGPRALLLYTPGMEYIEAFFGCLYAGIVPVPAYPPMETKAVQRLRAIIDNCQAQFVLSNQNILPMVEGWFEGLEAQGVQFLETETVETEKASLWEEISPDYNDLAFLQYTSGSTGSPKGVMIKHGNLLENLEQMCRNYQISDQDNGVSWLPPYHDMGLIGGILLPVYIGAAVTLMSPMTFIRKPQLWLQTISDTKAIVSAGPNFAYRHCVERISDAQKKTLDLSHWRVALNGAEPILATTMEDFFAAFAECGLKRSTLKPCYGMAEACLMVASADAHGPAVSLAIDDAKMKQGHLVEQEQSERRIVSSGRPPVNLEVVVVDPMTKQRLAEGEVGELWLSGPNICTDGYWGNPEATAAAFNCLIIGEEERGGYLRTGDFGAMINGEVFVTGRMKEIIILRGKNYYPQDIEYTVQTSSDAFKTSCGAAFSVVSTDLSEEQERLVVTQEITKQALKSYSEADYKASAESVARHIREQHGIHVNEVVFLKPNESRKTSSGKNMRAEMKNLYLANELKVVFHWHSKLVARQQRHESLPVTAEQIVDIRQGDFESTLASWINERFQLEITAADLNNSFSSIGLDSIDAVDVIGKIQSMTEQKIATTDLFKYPTIQSLIDFLRQESPLIHLPNIHPESKQRAESKPMSAKEEFADSSEDELCALLEEELHELRDVMDRL